jgi:hypothetical protein
MNGWFRYFALNAQVRAGFSRGIVVWAVLATVFGIVAAGFFLTAIFVWLADQYDPVTAGLVLGFLFLLLALIALLACVLTRRHNIERARTELAARGSGGPAWLDPKLLATGFQIGQAIGWRKLVSLGVVAVLGVVLAREWQGAAPEEPDDGDASP